MEALTQGGMAFYLPLGGALALLLGLLLLALYRRAVDRAMREGGAEASVSAARRRTVPAAPAPPLTVRTLAAAPADTARDEHWRSATFRGAGWAIGRTATVYLLAGLVQAVISAVLLLRFQGVELQPLRTAISVWSYAWPIVLTLALIWARDRRRVWTATAVYFGVLVLLGLYAEAVTDAPSLHVAGIPLPAIVQPLLVWAGPAVPTGILLLFLNRRVRAIGPLLLTVLLVALAGVDVVRLVMAGPRASAANEYPVLFYLLQALGFALFAIPGYALAVWLRNRYLRKRLSDQTLILDTVWLLASVVLCSSLAVDRPEWAWLGLTAFAGYKLVVRLGLGPLEGAARARPPARLLLLRVFGDQARSEHLLDLLGARWRYAGPIQLIAGTDLATSNIEPDEFLDFLSNRLHTRFIHTDAERDARLQQVDVAPDPDGRFRVNEFFCASGTWQGTVQALMATSDLVVMDLRGFSPANQGCVFELGALVDTVPIDRVVFLVDASTDEPFLQRTLDGIWRSMRADSPNAGAARATATLLATTGREAASVRALTQTGDRLLATAASG